MDLETVLDRAPQIQLGGLKKNDAVMIVATEDGDARSLTVIIGTRSGPTSVSVTYGSKR